MGCSNSVESEDSNKKLLHGSNTIIFKDDDLAEGGFNRETKTEKVEDIKINPTKFVRSEKDNQYIKKTYKVKERIGNGSYGKVFKVYHYDSRAHRAMKVIKKEYLKQQDDDKLFLKEIEIMTSLDHPNILKILEYFMDDNYYYIVTELITGGELFDHVAQLKNFSEVKACMIMEQLFSAVNYLHHRGIVHRDIKLENIMVEKSDKDNIQIKIIDFGASNFFKKNMGLKMKIGTPYYIAPDVLKKNYSYKCDMWSCGVLMFILLSGYPPFDGKTDQEIMDKVKIGKFSFDKKIWDDISTEAKNLINQLLQLDPKLRLTAEAAIKHPWMIKFGSKIKSSEDIHKISRINTFQLKHKLQQTTIAFLIHQLSSNKNFDNLRKIFTDMDKSKKGRLLYDDIKEGLNKYSDLRFSDEEFNNLLKQLDNDGNGYIEYEEFLRATMDMDVLLTENNLRMAFNFFDTDNSGKLSKDEIKNILGVINDDPEKENELIKTILGDLETKDGLISFEDFEKIMKNACSEIVYSKDTNFGSMDTRAP
jgi:calcium-dependent protein kinase